MVKMRVVTVLCDECGSDKDIVPVRIGVDGGPLRRIDLCAHHAKPLRGMVEKVTTRRTGRRTLAELPVVDDVPDIKPKRRRRNTPTRRPEAGSGATNTPTPAPEEDSDVSKP